MASMIQIDLRPDSRTLRQFGWIALVGFGLMATLAWNEWLVFSVGLGEWRQPVVAGLAGLAGLAGFFSIVYPKANLPIYLGLTILAYPIGFVLSYVIMGTIFYLMLAPMGIIFRITGRDPMKRRFEPETASYWVDSRPARPNESYFRQF
jgi:hypothetical protein